MSQDREIFEYDLQELADFFRNAGDTCVGTPYKTTTCPLATFIRSKLPKGSPSHMPHVGVQQTWVCLEELPYLPLATKYLDERLTRFVRLVDREGYTEITGNMALRLLDLSGREENE